MVNIQLASEEWVNGQLTGSTGGGTGSTSVINVTYSGLSSMIFSSILTTNQSYLITDYQSVHIIPFTDIVNTGTTEPLLVTASGNNKLKPEAYSKLYPQDIIYYDVNNRQDMVPGCTKGYIYRRVDTLKNNDIPFDFRNVKFRRWQINVTNVWNGGTTYNKNSVVVLSGTSSIYICLKDNVIGPDPNPSTNNENFWKLFEWDNLTTVSPYVNNNWSFGSGAIIPCSSAYTDYPMFVDYSSAFNNKINQSPFNIIYYNNSVIFGSNFNDNTIESYFCDNTIGNSFSGNTIGNNFCDNTIGNRFKFNTIGINCQSNTFFNNCNHNIICANFKINSIKNDFSYNNIGGGFQMNIIDESFSGNTFGCVCVRNSIGSFNSGNIIDSGFTRNNMYCGFGGLNFSSATHVYGNYDKDLYTDSLGAKKLAYDRNTIVNATA